MVVVIMKEADSKKQFNMSYSGDSRFAEMLENPSFSIVLEIPSGDEMSSVKELLKFAADEPSVFAVALPDCDAAAPDKPQLNFAEDAIAITAKPVISYISGRDRSMDDILTSINRLRGMGLRDFVAVTGNLEKGTGNCMDSTDIMQFIMKSGADNCVGGVVNPFKYVHEDQFFQYSRFSAKMRSGARFFTAQAGWDMKKYQELIWYLRSREMLVPVLARVAVIDTSDEGILSSMLKPGVPVPLHIGANAQRCAANPEEFTREQTRLAALVAVGCRLMGYNGIQLSGIHTSAEFEAFLKNYDEITAKYSVFSSWAAAWNSEFRETALFPIMPNLPEGSAPFYLYDALMVPEVQEFDVKTAKSSKRKVAEPAFRDRLRYNFFASPETPLFVRKAAKWICRCRLNDAQLDGCLGVDPGLCPKGLLKGPCGNSTADGLCECGDYPCVFQRVLRLALRYGLADKLEGVEKA